MPGFRCLCGESINLSGVPNLEGFKLIWEPVVEKFVDEVVEIHQKEESIRDFEKRVYDAFYLRNPEFPQIYECPKCGQLAVFARASDNKPILWFHPEKTNQMGLRTLLEG